MNAPNPCVFYGSGAGDMLIDPTRFPAEIHAFLQQESCILDALTSAFSTLIEVGCMHGRFLEWGILKGKRYLGIDPVARYINEACARIQSLKIPCGDAQAVCDGVENLAQIVHTHRIDPQSALVFFPFNSIGNMPDIRTVFAALKTAGACFMISTYRTSKKATSARKKYYVQCGYQEVKLATTEQGVCFTSQDGLCTWAYHPEYLHRVGKEIGLPMHSQRFGEIGITYHSSQLTCSLYHRE